MRKINIKYLFFRKNSFKKMLVDAVVVFLVCAFVFEILPFAVTFFSLSTEHTTILQKLLHAFLALACVWLCRIILMVYKQPWNQTKTICYIFIIVADMMAGVLFYIIAEFAIHSVYPFLLMLSIFALIDIFTLFYRLLYKGFSEDYGFLEQ
jgi:hypothetical protein